MRVARVRTFAPNNGGGSKHYRSVAAKFSRVQQRTCEECGVRSASIIPGRKKCVSCEEREERGINRVGLPGYVKASSCDPVRDLLPPGPLFGDPDAIVRLFGFAIAKFSITPKQMRTHRRGAEKRLAGVRWPSAEARHWFCWAGRNLTHATLIEMALLLRTVHSAVAEAIRCTRERMAADPALAAKYREYALEAYASLVEHVGMK